MPANNWIRAPAIQNSSRGLYESFFTLLMGLAFALPLSAQTNSTPVKLAIVPESPEAVPVADLLTAEFSKNDKVQLLERAEIEKVYREQGLSAVNQDYLKLGQILGADGLLLMKINGDGPDQFLDVRLVAVKPGVVLVAERFSWPMKDMVEWPPSFMKHLDSFLPKLALLPKDAIPISIVNLRSAIASDEAAETERQLKLLTIERLSREPQMFVLERQRMESLNEEKELIPDESAFWHGSYLLDGTVDQNGYSKDTITISARLTPPQGGVPMQIEVGGSRTNLTAVVNELAAKVDVALKINATGKEWNAADEAAQYFDEAKWAMKWGVFQEAQTAAEAAWALGRQNMDVAALRVRSYSENVPLNSPVQNAPPENIFQQEIVVFSIPDQRWIEPITRALELYHQDAPLLLSNKNTASDSNFTMGLQLLRRAVGILESYYYAAELRAGNEERLADLREKTRQVFKALGMYLPSVMNQFPRRNDLLQNYDWLKWNEGGICLERPEDAVPLFRQLVETGYYPDSLPRIVGWSWESRKRTPSLTKQFVNEVCASTNPAVHLQGLYLAVLLAPNDEAGSLKKREQELVSAMWENRQSLFSSAENISLVERAKNTLRAKYDYPYSNPNDYYDHEPFASFKHNLRMDFLEHASGTNLDVFQALFPNTSEKMETPDQARELLPLAVSYQQKLPSSPVLGSSIDHLRQVAGVAEANSSEPIRPPVQAGQVLEAKFIKWNLLRPGIDIGRIPNFFGMIFRDGKLWLRARYFSPDGAPIQFQHGFQTTYVGVDPQTGVKEEIPFPEKFGEPADLFEVNNDSLFVGAGNHLYRFKFQDGAWEEISAPMEDSTRMVWLKENLFVARNDGLVKIKPDSKEVQILVSSRRQPPLNEIDLLWTAQMQIYPRADGNLGVLSDDQCLSFDPTTERWSKHALPVAETNNYFNFRNFFTSAGGAQEFLTGAVAHRYLVGYWNDNHASESLLMESSPFKMKDSANERLLQPVRWDWPQSYPLEPSSIVADDQALWILCPRKIYQHDMVPFAEEPVKFSDERQATLFHFESEFRQPQAVPVRFENDASINIPNINGRPVEMLSPTAGGYLANWERLVNHAGNSVFWLKTPDGLVFGAPNYCGHWFIPNTALEPKLELQRQQSKMVNANESSKP